jgi:hypothetical protein
MYIPLTTGLFGFDKLGFESFPKLQFYYWGGIPEALRRLGCRVVLTKVPRYYDLKYTEITKIVPGPLPSVLLRCTNFFQRLSKETPKSTSLLIQWVVLIVANS